MTTVSRWRYFCNVWDPSENIDVSLLFKNPQPTSRDGEKLANSECCCPFAFNLSHTLKQSRWTMNSHQYQYFPYLLVIFLNGQLDIKKFQLHLLVKRKREEHLKKKHYFKCIFPCQWWQKSTQEEEGRINKEV